MEAEGQILTGTLAPPRGRRPKTCEGTRECSDPDCATRLSRYNHGERCYLHQRPRFPRIRGVPSEA